MASTGIQIETFLHGYRDPATDSILAGGKVYPFGAGTLVYLAAYLDSAKTQEALNGTDAIGKYFTLGVDGRAEVFGDGVYKFRIYTAGGVFVEELDNQTHQVPSTSSTKNVTTTTTNYTVVSIDDILEGNTTSGNITFAIGFSAASAKGKELTFKKIAAANSLIIDPYGSETTEVSTLASLGEEITLYSDGANWRRKSGSAQTLLADGAQRTASATAGANIIPVGDTNGRIAWGAKPAFRGALLHNTGDTAATTIAWPTVVYDTDSFFNASTPTYFTIPAGVTKVRLSGGAMFNSATTNNDIAIHKTTDSAFVGRYKSRFYSSANTGAATIVTPVIAVAAGDKYAMSTNGGTVTGGTGWFAIEVLE